MKAANGNCNLLKYFFKLKKTIKNQNFKILYMFLFWTVGQKYNSSKGHFDGHFKLFSNVILTKELMNESRN